MFSAPSAYAAETHDYTETATSINGLEGTDKTHSMSDNKITLGTEGGPTNKPFSTYGTISGGGKKNATEDVSNNTLTIHGLQVSNGSGQSMIYGGVSGTGAVTNNRVFFNNGLSKDPIYGGFNGASATKAVTGNSVTVAGGTVEGDIQGGGTEGTGAVTGNTVTLSGGSFKDEAMGGIIRNSSSSAEISDNTVTMTDGTLTKANTKLLGAYTAGSGNVKNNHVILSGGTVGTSAGGNVYGGYAAGNGTVTGNTIAISGGTIGGSGGGNVYGGYSDGSGAVTGNTVTISGGTLGGQAALTTAGKIYGGFSNGTGTTTGNRVNLGTEDGTYTAGTGMSRVQIFGGNRTSNTSDNALHVYAKDVAVEKISNFDTFNFHLTAPVAAGDTMLTMGTGSIGGTANWTKLMLDAAGWNNDKTKYGNIGNVILMHAGSGSDIVFSNYAAKTGKSGDFEYNITAQAGMLYPTRTQTQNVTATLSRFKNADATANNVTGTEVYGGYSSLGNTTTNNKIKITNTNNANLSVYGGYTAGAGDSTDNHVTVSLDSRAKQIGKMVVGGTATVSNSAIVGNSVTVEGGYVGQGAVGGLAQTSHTGSLKNNTFTLKGDGAVAMAFGALAQGGSGTVGGDSADDGNHVVIEGGRAADGVYGGATMGTGKVAYNTVTISGGEIGSTGAYGGANIAAGAGTVAHNSLTVAGGKIEGSVYGGFSRGTGTVTDNTVTINGGRFENTSNIYGGYAHGNGTTENNIVNLGDDTHHDLSGAMLSASDIYGGNKAATGNTLNVNAKNITAKSVNNFENYKFRLNDDIAKNGGSMLTLTENNGFNGGNLFDWTKLDVDTSKLSGNTVIGNVTLLTGTTNGLKFSNYAGKDRTHGVVNGDYETALRTDTNTGTASKVILDYNRFQNNTNATYDGSISAITVPHSDGTSSSEIYGGISYAGNTTTNNHLTVTNLSGDVTSAYGGKTAGRAGNSTGNSVTVAGTGSHGLANVYGGFIGNAASNGAATDNEVTISGGKIGTVHGGYTKGTGAVTGNTVTFSGGATLHDLMGGYADNAASAAAVTNNIVNLAGGTIGGTVYGGRTLGSGDVVTGNQLNVRGTVKAGQIANFEHLNFDVNQNTAGKTLLTINGGAATNDLDWSKLRQNVTPENMTTSSYGATRVTLIDNAHGIGFTNYNGAKGETHGDLEFLVDTDNGTKDAARYVYADTYRFKDNKTASYTESDGSHDFVWGGRSELGNTAEGNVLTVTGGTITDTAYGGTSRRGITRSNQLVMRGGTAQNLVGGFGASASDNTVDIFGGTIGGDVYGGRATNGAASGNTVSLFGAVNIGGTIHGGAGTSGSVNNTLAVHAFGAQAADFANVQNLHFYLPAGTTPAETRTMLTLTNTGEKNIQGLNLGVAIAGDAKVFQPGDAVSLLKVGGTLTTDAALRNTGTPQTMKATQGGILDYTLGIAKRGENELIATVKNVDVNDRSKSPVETRVAASALLNAGADLLSNVGYTAAAEAAAVISAGTAPAPSSAEGVRNTDAGLAAAGTAASAGVNASAAVNGAFQPWAAQGGSSVRLNSGSYVDAKGWNLNVGFARANKMGDATLTYGPFVEYGRSTYDSYLDDGTHGSGAMHYIGGGVMAKMAQDSGLYVEGSLRAGRVSSDYTGSDDAAELSYNNASMYFAGHVGVGQEWKLANGNKIEGYAKYFYSHQAGDTVKLRSGAEFDFGDVDSHRLRLGARYTHAVGGGSELYAGLAYEHEFGGDAAATYQGYSTPSPSLGGGTGILELGYRFAPKDGRVSYGVNLMGMTGQREGIAGGAQVTWAF
ncbi:autotransporter outer membrane beta-barrel domain-containing protein [Selenomonas sp. oral taxon 138]|uniref:autotransporter outer membrane beta-barrel domain-containing protein n=1 Tax=Selenomonas sp. oral taxon 138 TaxID=712532 RepID=UPI00034A5D01|nr:autotransporter outer membrane beta-barrel domain-containing protein [Selenomonas sp. oral taxon 138]